MKRKTSIIAKNLLNSFNLSAAYAIAVYLFKVKEKLLK